MTTGGGPPRVSIVMPAYNREQYIARTLDSVRAQTVADWELVISDDGSTDGTHAIAARYAADDPRITIVAAANGGPARARNRGLAKTDPRSEFVIFLDSDDLWFPDSLEAMIAQLDDRPDLVSANGLAQCIDADDKLVPGDDLAARMRDRVEYRGWQLASLTPGEPTTFAGLVHRNYTTTGGQLIRRSVMDLVGAFDPDVDPADDWDISLRISRLGPVGFLDRVVLNWRRHADTSSSTAPRQRQAHFRVLAKASLAPENTPEQRRVARIGYLTAWWELLLRAWSNLRGRRPGQAARESALAVDSAVWFAAKAGSQAVRQLNARAARLARQ